MSKTSATVLALVIGVVSIAIPIFAALSVANRQSLDLEMSQALAISEEVLRRADDTSNQIASAFQRLRQGAAQDPCADSQIALMREIDITSSYLQTVGHAEGNFLICSSLGRHEPPLPLGPPDYVSSNGTSVHISVELPIAPSSTFLVTRNHGFVAVIHRGLPIDVFVHKKDISLGVIAISSKKTLSKRGNFDPQWLVELGQEREKTFFDGNYVVALKRSPTYDAVAFAAVPSIYLSTRIREFNIVLVPLGLLFGVILAIALIYLARLQNSLTAELRSALKRNEFFMLYQPIIDLRSGDCVGAEALIRWRRRDGELVRPDLFIPVAEESGLIKRITRRVTSLVAADVPELLQGFPHFHVGINLSPADLQSDSIIALLREMILSAGIRPENILVEATERGFLNTDVAMKIVRDIRAMGVRVAIDDFGTGYSSLSYLTMFEIDYLKIDKSFVDTIGKDAATSHVVLHIIEMAKSLNLEMIAEGVETEEQAQFLRERGVQYAQGWLFGKPMPVADLTQKVMQAQRAVTDIEGG